MTAHSILLPCSMCVVLVTGASSRQVGCEDKKIDNRCGFSGVGIVANKEEVVEDSCMLVQMPL